jgi:cyclic pyranopterin phosphate synthase
VEKVAATRGRIKAISISKEKGTPKVNVPKARLQVSFGIVGDAHAGNWNRQISLLSVECIDKMDKKGLNISPGDFAENITTEGINLEDLTIGSRLKLGSTVELEITKFGKTCHGHCQIYEQIGDCIMPRKGVFAVVIHGGSIHAGDNIEVVENGDKRGHNND